MAQDKENPLSRWSRRKRESASAAKAVEPAADSAGAKLPELPSLDQLGIDSDFSGFMDKRVDDSLRRLALKKLFRDPRYNLTDGLDVYSEDYSLLEDLPQAVVATLEHARRVLNGPDPEPPAPAEAEPSTAVTSGAPEQESGKGDAPPLADNEAVPQDGEAAKDKG